MINGNYIGNTDFKRVEVKQRIASYYTGGIAIDAVTRINEQGIGITTFEYVTGIDFFGRGGNVAHTSTDFNVIKHLYNN